MTHRKWITKNPPVLTYHMQNTVFPDDRDRVGKSTGTISKVSIGADEHEIGVLCVEQYAFLQQKNIMNA